MQAPVTRSEDHVSGLVGAGVANAHAASQTGVAVIGTVERAEGVHNHLVLRVSKRVVHAGIHRAYDACGVGEALPMELQAPYYPTASP